MQRQQFREEEEETTAYRDALGSYADLEAEAAARARRGIETELPTEATARTASSAPLMGILTWIGGVASGSLGAAAMATLARIQNPEMLLGGSNAWLLYALLGAITGFCAAVGRRKAAWTAAGMSLAVLLSPPLLVLLLSWLGQWGSNPATSPLVISAALPIGAFVFLNRASVGRATVQAAAAFFVIDLLYNLIAAPAATPAILLWYAWVSALHGGMLGGLLAVLRRIFDALVPQRPAPSQAQG